MAHLRQSVVGLFDLCTGCRVCELVCSSKKYGYYDPKNARIKISDEHEGLASFPKVCIQCERPYCMNSCPVQAIERDEETGIVRVIPEKCTGCATCVKACPVGEVIKIEPESNKAIKCDLCDGDPKCVKFCPTQAVRLVKIGKG